MYHQGIQSDDVLHFGAPGFRQPATLCTPNTFSTRPHRTVRTAFPRAASAVRFVAIWRSIFVAERTLVPAPSNFRLRASAANVTAPHPDGWNPLLSPSRARNILQIHRETRKQPHECPERGNVACRSGLYKMTSWAPRGALIIGIKMERFLNIDRETNIGTSSFCSKYSPLRQAPCAGTVQEGKYI